MAPPTPDLVHRLRAVGELTKLFHLERMVYVSATGLSVLLLFSVAIKMLLSGETSVGQWSLMFGSTGLISLTIGGLLRMWNQAIRLVASEPVDGRTPGGKDD